MRGAHFLFRRALRGWNRREGILGLVLLVGRRTTLPELIELRELREEVYINACGQLSENVSPALRCAEVRAPCVFDQPRLLQVSLGPMDSICEHRLTPAWK